MYRIALIAIVCVLSTNALALKAIEDGKAWNRATSAERDALVRKIMAQSKVDYPDAKLRECLDDFYSPSAPAANLDQEIVSATIRCQAKLKPRK